MRVLCVMSLLLLAEVVVAEECNSAFSRDAGGPGDIKTDNGFPKCFAVGLSLCDLRGRFSLSGDSTLFAIETGDTCDVLPPVLSVRDFAGIGDSGNEFMAPGLLILHLEAPGV